MKLTKSVPPGAPQHPGDPVVAVVSVVVHLPEHEVVRLGVERPVICFAGAGLALPEGRGVHPPERVPHPELLDREAAVVLGELAQPAAVPAESVEELEPPSADDVAAATHSGTPAGRPGPRGPPPPRPPRGRAPGLRAPPRTRPTVR